MGFMALPTRVVIRPERPGWFVRPQGRATRYGITGVRLKGLTGHRLISLVAMMLRRRASMPVVRMSQPMRDERGLLDETTLSIPRELRK